MIYKIGERRLEQRGSGHWIADNATVIGSVIMEANSSIWFNAVLRADNDVIEIGENTNIQDGAVLHVDPGVPMMLGRDVTVGQNVMLHVCTVGDNRLLGLDAVVRNLSLIHF